MGAYFYYDGFNLYYRLFKNKGRRHKLPARFKWLDLLKLSANLTPGQPVDWIGYFTARVAPNTFDPGQHRRQKAYLDALDTIQCLEIVEGTFQPRTKRGIPSGCPTCGKFQRARIDFDTFEEKGSDVNLAARLVRDAALGSFSEAVVVSNDSDLEEAVRIATQDFGRIVHVRSPDLFVIGALARVATSAIPLDARMFRHCEFPDVVPRASGVPIHRPRAWRP